MTNTEFIRRQWFDLCQALHLDLQVSETWWNKLSDLYSAPVRAYHTLQHLENMLSLYFAVQSSHSLFSDQSLVFLCVFFHDAIYEPKAADNEEQSAILFRQFATEAALAESQRVDVAKISQLILQTQKHSLSSPELADQNVDETLFLDLDLSILGSEADEYDRYSHNIRREYSFYQLDAYRSGRSKVLSSFLERSRIFYSHHFHCELEDKARANLTREIAFLQSDRSLSLDQDLGL